MRWRIFFSQSYQLDQSISVLRIVDLYFILIRILIEHYASKQWKPRSDAEFCGVWSGGLHCLHMLHKQDARLICVKLKVMSVFPWCGSDISGENIAISWEKLSHVSNKSTPHPALPLSLVKSIRFMLWHIHLLRKFKLTARFCSWAC